MGCWIFFTLMKLKGSLMDSFHLSNFKLPQNYWTILKAHASESIASLLTNLIKKKARKINHREGFCLKNTISTALYLQYNHSDVVTCSVVVINPIMPRTQGWYTASSSLYTNIWSLIYKLITLWSRGLESVVHSTFPCLSWPLRPSPGRLWQQNCPPATDRHRASLLV